MPRPPRALLSLLALLALLVRGVPPVAAAVDAAAIAVQIAEARCGPNYDPCAPPAGADDPVLFCDYAIGPEAGGYCKACGGEANSFCSSLFAAVAGGVLTDSGLTDCLEKCTFKACDEECAAGEFCSFFDRGDGGSPCMSCADLIVHPEECVDPAFRMPDEGVAECQATCPARSCTKARHCMVSDPWVKFFCHIADDAGGEGGEPAGTCAPCGDLASTDECAGLGASEKSAQDCVDICEGVMVTSCLPKPQAVEGKMFQWELPGDDNEACKENHFCNEDYEYTCETCPGMNTGYNDWHVDFCFEQDYMGLNASSAQSCADNCRTECQVITAGSIEVDGVVVSSAQNNVPPYGTVIRDVTGPLVDCKFGGLGECPADAPPDFVCLVSRGARKFSDKVLNCEEAGGVGAIMYDTEEDGSIVEGQLGDVPMEISMTAISLQAGLDLREQDLGKEITLSVKIVKETCNTGCSDRIPCAGTGYCNYKLGNGTYGFCDECAKDEEENGRKCFLTDLPIRGAQECAATCDSALFTTSGCKVCGQGVSRDVLKSATDDELPCDFCPGGMKQAVNDRKIPFMGNFSTCRTVYGFFENYQIADTNPNCQLALGFNYICDCEGPGYAGARTLPQRRALVWVPRTSAIMSLLGSAAIIVDVARDTDKRKKPYGQLMMVMSAFDILGSMGYAFTSLPIPAEYQVEGARGNDATCTAQGFFIQMGTIAALINVSLATYYYCVITLAMGDTSILDVRKWFFVVPIVVGMAFAGAGIPFYQMLFVWCNNSSNYWPDIPVALAILAVTGIMSYVCYDVWKTDQASRGGRMNNDDGRTPQTMSSRMFWQSVCYLFAFWLTWVPYLVLQYIWAAGKGYSSYAFTLFACAVVPLQGFSNAVVYFRRRFTKRATELISQARNRMSTGGTEASPSAQSSTGLYRRARASMCCSSLDVEGQTEGSTKKTGASHGASTGEDYIKKSGVSHAASTGA